MKTENEMEERFKQKLSSSNFDVLELQGFKERPDLALICGMGMGYKLAVEDLLVCLDKAIAGVGEG